MVIAIPFRTEENKIIKQQQQQQHGTAVLKINNKNAESREEKTLYNGLRPQVIRYGTDTTIQILETLSDKQQQPPCAHGGNVR